MAFGSQNGKTNGGFGSKIGGSFGSNSTNKNGTGFSGDKKSYFGSTQSGTSEKTGFGSTQNSTREGTGFGSKTTSNFGTSTSAQQNTGNSTAGINPNQSNTTNKPVANKYVSNTSANIFSLPCIRGKISQYRTYSDQSGNYRRLLPRKIYQAIMYGQRFEDFLHSFTLTETKGVDRAGNPITQKYVVNVHGSTNFGATLLDNEEVEVRGKFTGDNILMARDIRVINGSISTPIKFQRSVKMIAVLTLVFIGIVLLLSVLLSGGNGSLSGVMNNVKGFVTTLIAVYVILLILYFVSSFTKIGFMTRLLSGGRRRNSPLIVMLIIAFILTLFIYNVSGLGTAIGNT
ncbi:MAG: hypothetical protein LIO87_10490 [Eubacterium sp.]|nr:hypothetical protein [Eubacterium sp.]